MLVVKSVSYLDTKVSLIEDSVGYFVQIDSENRDSEQSSYIADFSIASFVFDNEVQSLQIKDKLH